MWTETYQGEPDERAKQDPWMISFRHRWTVHLSIQGHAITLHDPSGRSGQCTWFWSLDGPLLWWMCRSSKLSTLFAALSFLPFTTQQLFQSQIFWYSMLFWVSLPFQWNVSSVMDLTARNVLHYIIIILRLRTCSLVPGLTVTPRRSDGSINGKIRKRKRG